MNGSKQYFGFVTLFPEMFSAIEQYGVIGRAVKKGLISMEAWNPRDFTQDRHKTVDDRPYGGGPGMLMKVQPLQDAILAAKSSAKNHEGESVRTIYLSPQGSKLDHQKALELASYDTLILVSGRYEGVDERLIESEIDEEISIGDFVLSGGELASMVLVDAVSRLLPGVLGHSESAVEDSFVGGLLDHPHYTRPDNFANKCVPDVLLSGNHKEIRRWRLKQSLGRTWQRRPDLLEHIELDQEQQTLLQDFIESNAAEN
ncbi:MAG: tRNA (guanine37-N1)-methyltransferase [Pseudohongiellaceae bacterium]